MNVAVVVPRRSDGFGPRDAAWAYVRDWWLDQNLPPVEGHHGVDEGPFNRSVAVNRAVTASTARRWNDVLIIADADTVPNIELVSAGIAVASVTGRMVLPFDRFVSVSEADTHAVLAGAIQLAEVGRTETMAMTASSCVIVRRDLFDTVGGFDQGFVGWGFEDAAFSMACQTMAGPWERLTGDVLHLWHPPAEATGDRDHPLWQANEQRCARYIEAMGDRPAMRVVLDELVMVG